jgi:hypothetical protein
MKKFFLAILCICCFALSADALELTAQQQRLYDLAGTGYVAAVTTQANGLNRNFRSQNDIQIMRNWLKIEAGYSGSLAIVDHDSVYTLFLMKFENFAFGTVAVSSAAAQPTSCAVNGSDIECDDPGDQTLYLWSFDTGTRLATDTEDSPSCATGTCTFSSPGSGVYLVSRGVDYFPSTFLTIP